VEFPWQACSHPGGNGALESVGAGSLPAGPACFNMEGSKVYALNPKLCQKMKMLGRRPLHDKWVYVIRNLMASFVKY